MAIATRILVVLGLGLTPAWAQNAPPPGPAAMDTLAGNSQQIHITSDQLDIFDKENKAVFIGNVIAVQGDSTLKCTTMEVFYAPKEEPGADAQAQSGGVIKAGGGLPGSGTDIRVIECFGPVTLVSKTQVATGNHATFERKINKVFLKGNVVLKDGDNLSQGDNLVYDVTTGIAKIQGRVRTMIIPEDTKTPGATKKPGH
ncbi:MAG: organic solvent tolerance protein OstA [Methylobacteriaceae bacterium]|jgi:lipopolysaccharide export system protein LptA|nr:organic solvent tolerance protein OstA [Methylobacteriaceae bacterium]